MVDVGCGMWDLGYGACLHLLRRICCRRLELPRASRGPAAAPIAFKEQMQADLRYAIFKSEKMHGKRCLNRRGRRLDRRRLHRETKTSFLLGVLKCLSSQLRCILREPKQRL